MTASAAGLATATEALNESFLRVASAEVGEDTGCAAAVCSRTVPVLFGRQLTVPRCAGGVAWVEFEDICGSAVGAPDYVALAVHFHTVFLCGVPQLSRARRDRARRFITLVDELYNRGGSLHMSLAVPFEQLFYEPDAAADTLDFMALAEGLQHESEALEEAVGRRPLAQLEASPLSISDANRSVATAAQSTLYTGEDEAFAFARARSRMAEMQSRRYQRMQFCYS
eukprot:COSAG01_NODE_7075_length_3364_cov_16.109648_1_plen_226_part_00